jgi:hypothetical protein
LNRNRGKRRGRLKLIVLSGSDHLALNAYADQFRFTRRYTAISSAHLDWTLDDIATLEETSPMALLHLVNVNTGMIREVKARAAYQRWACEWHVFPLSLAWRLLSGTQPDDLGPDDAIRHSPRPDPTPADTVRMLALRLRRGKRSAQQSLIEHYTRR